MAVVKLSPSSTGVSAHGWQAGRHPKKEIKKSLLNLSSQKFHFLEQRAGNWGSSWLLFSGTDGSFWSNNKLGMTDQVHQRDLSGKLHVRRHQLKEEDTQTEKCRGRKPS